MRRFAIPYGSIREVAVFACAIAISIGAAAGVSAQMAKEGEAAVVSSTDAGALPPPAEWRCDLIRPEYADWLTAGNTAQDWRYAGATYRDADSGDLYDWGDWLAWAETADCASQGWMPSGRAAIGVAIGGLGAALLVSSNGANAKSPG